MIEAILSVIIMYWFAVAGKLDQVSVTATDHLQDAVVCARKNADKLKFLDSIQFEQCDMFPTNTLLQEDALKYDIIVANPPYLPGPSHTFLDTGRSIAITSMHRHKRQVGF